MMQVIEQTRDEKIAMYMKLTKREIIEMLLTNQEYVEAFKPNPGPRSWAEIEQVPPMIAAGSPFYVVSTNNSGGLDGV